MSNRILLQRACADAPLSNAVSVDHSLHECFERQVAFRPASIAVSCGSVEVTYYELNARANKLANHLRARGVGSGDLVGLHTDRGIDTVVGILGILKAGGAYLPLDPVYPAERIGFMLEDSRVSFVVTEEALAGTLAGTGAAAVLPGDWAGARAGNPVSVTGPDDLAYVIYTSGSTGKPKGVLVGHRNVTRLFSSTEAWYDFGPSDVWTMFHSYSFDFSVWEMWGALLYGGRVVVVPSAVSRSTEEFRELLIRERVTVLNQTPSAFRQLIKADMAHDPADYALRTVIFGGEALEFQSLRPWFERYGDTAPQLVNMYGITETTVHVTYRPVSLADLDSGQGSVIGEPIPDLSLHILDPDRKPVPTGETGEMYVGGAGVAAGYLNRPDLTAERFLEDPSTPGGRLYRTGDLARRLENGEVEYLGRIDHQVKIRGFRIELGEIEATIATFPGIREVCVIAREDQPGDLRLVAYVVAPGLDDLSEPLRAHLNGPLPDYMVPAAFVQLPALPLTENGKVDRKALPAPELGRDLADLVLPRTPVEEQVAGIWCEVLGLDRIGVQENFFELGGHSLLVIDVIQRLRAIDLHVDAGQIFLTPTVEAVAAAVTETQAEVEIPANRIPEGCTAITPDMLPLVDLSDAQIATIAAAVPGGAANIQDIYPQTPLQEGMVYHHQVADQGDIYLVTTVLGADSRDRLLAYVDALQQVVDRHDILRTAFMWRGLPNPVQVVLRKAELVLEEPEIDPAQGDVAEQLLTRYDPRRNRIDIGQAPLFRLYLAPDPANDRWVLLRIHHHLLEDHTADELMSEEIIAILDGRGEVLPAPIPFRDFAVRARDAARAPEVTDYFRRALADVDEPTVPFGFTDLTGDGAAISERRALIGGALATRLRRVALDHQVSAASIFHLAWANVIARCSGREDVVFGTVLFGRMHAGRNAERVVAPFINSLPLRLNMTGLGVDEALQQTHRRMAELLSCEHASLAMAQAQSGVPADYPLFNALLNFRHLKIRGEETPDANHAMAAAIRRMGLELIGFEERTNYPLEMSVDDLGDGFMIEAQVQSPIDPGHVCSYVQTALAGIVEALETAPDRPMAEIGILSEEAFAELVHGANDTVTGTPGGQRMDQRVAALAAEIPDRTAVRIGAEELSYAELDARANRIARELRARGVSRGDLVGVGFAVRADLPAILIGIHRAGAAYVPLDPGFPKDRLRYMAEDAGLALLIGDAASTGPFAMAPERLLLLDSDAERIGARSGAALDPDPACEAGPEDPAYVIYTSGSTGKPKGVAVPHRAVANFLDSMAGEPGLAPGDTLLSVTTLSFDIAVLELFLPLVVGATVSIATRDEAADAIALQNLLSRHGATVMQATPTTWRMMLAAGWTAPKGFRALIGGEALPGDLATRLVGQGVELWNMYGPTETTVWSSCARIDDPTQPITIGRPIANTAMYVLDRTGQPCPPGVPGELFIGGQGVALGYWRRAELTAERFLPNPFRAGEVMFRTGDSAKWTSDGRLEHLGRLDFQAKLRGYRIELGEIESCLLDHAGVRDAVVILREDRPGDQQLVAYVVPEGSGGDGLPGRLRDHLRGFLPAYMLPSAYVLLEALPLTPNAKIDRRALPAPAAEGAADRPDTAPRTDLERDLARVWQEVLSLPSIGIDTDFFEIGGHSLLALEVVSRVDGLQGLTNPMRAMLKGRTIRRIAALASGEKVSDPVEAPAAPCACEAADRATPDAPSRAEASPAPLTGPELVRQMGFWALVREDLSTRYRNDWTTPGFRALFTYRFGTWRLGIRNPILRRLTWILYRSMFRYVRNVYGIELTYKTRIGRRFLIAHQGGIVIHENAVFGDNCHIRQGVTIGRLGTEAPDDPSGPVIGANVSFGVGSVVLGSVTIGDNVTIAPNCLVTTDVPANTAVFMPLPRMVPRTE